MFTEETLQKGLRTQRFGSKIYTFDTIDSTNNCARALAGCWAEEGTVIIAEQQTAGKGRLGRVWQANPNENLTFSLILRPSIPQASVNLLPLYVAVAVAKAVEETAHVKVECKWPNDLLVDGKKFAGILLEGSIKQDIVEYIVIGIGINVNQQKFSVDLQQRATSLRIASKKEQDRTELFRAILFSLEEHYRDFISTGFQKVLPHWLAYSTMVDKEISVSQQGNVFSGVVRGISNDGGLVLESNGVKQTLFAGDVTVVGMEA